MTTGGGASRTVPCANCGQPVHITGRAPRAGKRFCSERECRTAADRARDLYDGPHRLYTATAAAAELGISRQRVIQLAEARNVGSRPVRGVWLFTPDDLDNLREPRKPGRPRLPTAPPSGTTTASTPDNPG